MTNNGGHDLQFVSVSDLANSPERYHGKEVLVNAYVLYESEAVGRELPALYQSEILTSFKDCVWLITLEGVEDIDPWDNLLSDEGKMITRYFGKERVFIRGVFDAQKKK
jgi:hypothetical protein